MASQPISGSPRAGRRRRWLIACLLLGLAFGGVWAYRTFASPLRLLSQRKLTTDFALPFDGERTFHDGNRTISITDSAIQVR